MIGKITSWFCLMIALFGILVSSAQDQKKLLFEDRISIRHSYFGDGTVKRLRISDGDEKISFSKKDFLKDLQSETNGIYESTEQLAFLPQIEHISRLSTDIIVFKGNYPFFGSVQHLIFYSTASKSIVKWVAYYASYENVINSLFFYTDSNRVLLKNNRNSIYQQKIYVLKYRSNSVKTILPSKSTMRTVGVGLGASTKEDWDTTRDEAKEYFEFDLYDLP